MNIWALPECVQAGGADRKINADFRDILLVLDTLNDPQVRDYERALIALNLFYDDFDAIPRTVWEEAAAAMLAFINLGEREPAGKRPAPRRIDWEQDAAVIISEVNRVAGTELRALPFVHWWTFIGYFSAIGEGQLSTIVGIREKLRKKEKLERWEKDYLMENRSQIELKKRYTVAEQAEIDRINAIFDS